MSYINVRTILFVYSHLRCSPCPNLSDYCGGNFQGIIEHLDYIQGMGFDAIWISPVVENTPQGYHGYWAKDLTKINSHFGTSDDLKALVTACHQKGMWVMLDVVANHMGPVGYNYSGLYPFNQSSYFHDCNLCPNQCTIQDYTCFQPEVSYMSLTSPSACVCLC